MGFNSVFKVLIFKFLDSSLQDKIFCTERQQAFLDFDLTDLNTDRNCGYSGLGIYWQSMNANSGILLRLGKDFRQTVTNILYTNRPYIWYNIIWKSVICRRSWKSRAIPLLPLWAVRPVQRLSACTRVHFTRKFVFSAKSEFSSKLLVSR